MRACPGQPAEGDQNSSCKPGYWGSREVLNGHLEKFAPYNYEELNTKEFR
jgi:hypothetical protein